MSRRIARETALQVLFQVEIAKVEPMKALNYTATEFAVPDSSREFARQLISGTLASQEQIDKTIKTVAKEWNLERMSRVDRNILRVAVYELFFCADIPGNVTINEAVELAKIYSGEEAGKFVNGILGALLLKSGKGQNRRNNDEVETGQEHPAGEVPEHLEFRPAQDIEAIISKEPTKDTLLADTNAVVPGDQE